MKKLKTPFIVFFLLLTTFWGVRRYFIRPANADISKKLELIIAEIKEMGYNPIWFVISGKRDIRLAELTYNSAGAGSPHLAGIAIDIEVIDVDGDWDFDCNDVNVFKVANLNVEKKYPKLKGMLGTYRGPKSDWLEMHQIHIDTRYGNKWRGISKGNTYYNKLGSMAKWGCN